MSIPFRPLGGAAKDISVGASTFCLDERHLVSLGHCRTVRGDLTGDW